MKRKSFIIIFIIITGIFSLINDVRGDHSCQLFFLETDKEFYYNDEIIKINASWSLEYDAGDISYVQVQIFNETNDLIWVSPQYSESGLIENVWLVTIKDLNTSFNSNYNLFYIKIYYYLQPPFSGPEESFLPKTVQIITTKRNASCQLIGVPSQIKYGEALRVRAVFYDISQGDESYLANYLIAFKIISNGIITYNNNFTTNSSGMIEIVIQPINLTKGINFLVFEIKESQFYNNLSFENKIVIVVDSEIQDEKISEEQDSHEDNLLQLSIVSFISILSISFLILVLICYNNIKKSKKQDLVDMTFRY
ncbi:MAG: hypothetical protein ACFFAH_13740 [Promethearchaeota archaeon]